MATQVELGLGPVNVLGWSNLAPLTPDEAAEADAVEFIPEEAGRGPSVRLK
jgi:hypothetical protein